MIPATEPEPFPLLDEAFVQRAMHESVHDAVDQLLPSPVLAAVPPTRMHALSTVADAITSAQNSRRLLVLRQCLQLIFDGRVVDARKLMSAVVLSMKMRLIRVALCQELAANLNPPTRATLNPAQFDLVVRLMNSALEHEPNNDDADGVAYSLLALARTYCRVGAYPSPMTIAASRPRCTPIRLHMHSGSRSVVVDPVLAIGILPRCASAIARIVSARFEAAAVERGRERSVAVVRVAVDVGCGL